VYIGLRAVSFGYEPGNPILENLSLSIEKGQAVALMGANGSGKTTALNLLSGLLSPRAGCVHFDGQDLDRQQMKDPLFMKQFHQRVGMIFQRSDTQLFCSSVYEEIAFGPRQMGLSEGQVERRVKDMLALLNIESLADQVPYHLSGGQKKRVAMAATLALNPDVLLLDEPMAALDPRSQKWVLSLLQSLRQAGKTLVIATHDLHRVQDMVDRIVLFDEAHHIVADDSPQAVLQSVDLLKAVNLVDDTYHVHVHRHGDSQELHIHL